MKSIKKSGLILASAAAALLASGFATSVSAAEHHDVKCVGGNACKGKSECKGQNLKGKENACRGQNACKGEGWAKMTDQACKKVKGAKAEALEEKGQ
jgi:hypothetical protein